MRMVAGSQTLARIGRCILRTLGTSESTPYFMGFKGGAKQNKVQTRGCRGRLAGGLR